MRDIRHDDGGACFTHVPKYPHDAFGVCKAVVSIECRRDDLFHVRRFHIVHFIGENPCEEKDS